MTDERDFEAETYHAIGRFVVDFGYMVSEMQHHLANRLVSERLHALPWIVMGEMTAGPIANSFFGACRAAANSNESASAGLDNRDEQVVKILAKAVQDAIKFRNDVAHGDWDLTAWQFARAPVGHSELIRLRPSRKQGHVEVTQIHPVALLKKADGLRKLSGFLDDLANLCFADAPGWKGHHVADLLVVQNSEVVREGPLAGKLGPWSS